MPNQTKIQAPQTQLTQTKVPVVLADTTLCAIVRDEMINPAQLPGKSGVRSFVESHVPYVEQAVIVDTGSVDGTREELEQLKSEFPNLRVKDYKFNGYASSRNFSLRQAKTPRILVLDTDELLRLGDINIVKSVLEREPLQSSGKLALEFHFRIIEMDGIIRDGEGHPQRLFLNSEDLFFKGNSKSGELWEFLYKRRDFFDGPVESTETIIPYPMPIILHFNPGNIQGLNLKMREWYYQGFNVGASPHDMPHFKDWKQPNHHRHRYT
jgi:glycosyltransferase involved in cell wall biosynthesis